MRHSHNPRALSEMETFFRRLRLPHGHYSEIRSVIPDKPGARQQFCSSPEEAILAAREAAGFANVYVSACPRSKRKGSRDAVSVVTAAWADLDFCDISPEDREASEKEALDRVQRFPVYPTLLIHSGKGLQAWWLFREPISISVVFPIERFEAINRGIAQALGGDAVHDLARVLRVPGTMNLPDARKRARGCVPVMARLVHCDGPEYDPDQFRQLVVTDIRSQRRTARERTPTPCPEQPDPDVLEAFRSLLSQLGANHPLSRTWRGERSLNDSSRSGWDMALANQLYKVGIKEKFVPHIVRAYPFGRGVFATADYVERTMAKAKTRWRDHRGTPRTARPRCQ